MTKQPPDVPLSAEAERLMAQLRPRIQQSLMEVDRVPVSVLIWGPGVESTSPLTEVRLRLRATLRQLGHAACFSEELCELGGEHSLRLQQFAQARQFDLIVSIPATDGSIAEVHDIVGDRRVSAKLIVFLNREKLRDYSAQSLLAMSSTFQVEYYPSEQDTSIIEVMTLSVVQKMRELKYLVAGRY